MDNDLEPAVHFALMQILSAVYESGIVDYVALGDVLRLLGAQPDEDENEAVVFSFDDPGWLRAYTDFKNNAVVPEVVIFDDGEEITLDELNELAEDLGIEDMIEEGVFEEMENTVTITNPNGNPSGKLH